MVCVKSFLVKRVAGTSRKRGWEPEMSLEVWKGPERSERRGPEPGGKFYLKNLWKIGPDPAVSVPVPSTRLWAEYRGKNPANSRRFRSDTAGRHRKNPKNSGRNTASTKSP